MSEKENSRSDCAVKIAVRERPFSSEEQQTNVGQGIETYSSDKNILIVEDRPFGFDHVFGQTSTQDEVFDAIGRPLVQKMLEGFNCSLLAYGQSGNGKTYTMGLDGQSEIEKSAKDAGIIIRTLRSIFEEVQVDDNISDILLEVSFIEIYNERVYDLLSPNYTEAEKFKKLFTKRELKCEADAKEILAEAYQKRHVRPTKINLTSSRSHAVFTIYATIKTCHMSSIRSELNLVDLAGAEGVRKTGHHGQALTEGVNINQGLLSVGRILQAISKGDKVIPYRESVLTRVLQESLNRNCFLTLLACVSPSKLDTKETLSTLRFAENVGTLKNNPKINVIMNEINMARRKTPTKPTFTPRANSALKRTTIHGNSLNATLLKKKKLNFPPALSSTAKKGPPNNNNTNNNQQQQPRQRQPFSMLPGDATVGRPTEQDFSFAAANISTSTFIHNPLDNTQQTMGSSYSPVIRRCMSTFESKLEERISAAVNDIASKIMGNSTLMLGKDHRFSTVDIANHNETTTTARRRTRQSHDRAIDVENGTFKVPNMITLQVPKRIVQSTRDEEDGIGQEEDQLETTFDFGDISTSSVVPAGETTLIRRSRRVQVLKSRMVQAEERRLQEMAKAAEEEAKRRQRENEKKNPRFVKNKYLASYFRLSTQLDAEESLRGMGVGGGEAAADEDSRVAEKRGRKRVREVRVTTHAEEVLKILNQGNLRELQILPQIGMKTAYQIMTYRATKGKFKSFKDLKKLNWTEKKVDRFMKDNYVE